MTDNNPIFFALEKWQIVSRTPILAGCCSQTSNFIQLISLVFNFSFRTVQLTDRQVDLTPSPFRACLHGERVTLLGESPFYEGQKIAPFYMQSAVPRAITIIEFRAEGDNCTVAKYKATKIILW